VNEGRIVSISGPLVIAKGLSDARMYEIARVGRNNLFGEIIELHKDRVYIQVYEETEGLSPGEPVILTGEPLSVQLGPGLIGSIYDGIQRPLTVIYDSYGPFITRGVDIPALPLDKKWHFFPLKREGEEIKPFEKIGYVQESEVIKHFIFFTQSSAGIVKEIKDGEFKLEEEIAKVEIQKSNEIISVKMLSTWPVRTPRPYKEKVVPIKPLITGQRVIDTFFPVAEGGTACVPGPFGSGKTVIQHQLAKWASADIIIYVGCGERGNEMTDVLMEFPLLKDPRTGKSLMERTVLIANTSNMPVAAREASVFTGITIAEYFRDMGYSVALMADSTSRWAEAMREISGRLEEMPGEEGYPAYLASRIASFYERSGRVRTLSNEEGSLSVIGAVSPPGGDLSEPVVQSTLRVVKVFWSLEDTLAYARHFPAIHWLNSYSLYSEMADTFFDKSINKRWRENRTLAMNILQRESELQEIVRLVGMDALSEQEKLTMAIANSIKEDFLHQNAFDEIDTYTSPKKQFLMLNNILIFYNRTLEILPKGFTIDAIMRLPVREKISRVKYIPEEEINKCDLAEEIEEAFKNLTEKGEVEEK
jgi:V/A-type H+-transporting ATPase subunit A